MSESLDQPCRHSVSFRASFLPPELWRAIFQQIVSYDVHIFEQSARYRRRKARELQLLQYVCRKWRDLIRPLLHQHTTMEGTKSGDTEAFIQFMQTIDSGKEDILRPPRIRSVWILLRRHGRSFRPIEMSDSQTSALDNALLNWIPRMRNLRELCCRMLLNFDQIACVARHHATTLTKLAIVCNATELAHVLSSLGQFTVLSDLSVNVAAIAGPQAMPLKNQPLPDSIRMLEVITRNASPGFILWHWRGSPLPNLERFHLSVNFLRESSALYSFMAVHGSKLRTVRFAGLLGGAPTTLYPLMPQLQVLILWHPYSRDVQSLLHGLPLSVEKVIIHMRTDVSYIWNSVIENSLSVLLDLPKGHHLSVVKVVSADPHYPRLARGTFSWRRAFAREPVGGWRSISANAGALKQRGIPFLDERAEELADVL